VRRQPVAKDMCASFTRRVGISLWHNLRPICVGVTVTSPDRDSVLDFLRKLRAV
jgi:hypothetical protein